MGVLTASPYGGYTLNSKNITEAVEKTKKILALVFAIFIVFSAFSSIVANASVINVEVDASSGQKIYTVEGYSDEFSEKGSHGMFAGFALDLVYMTYGGLFDTLSGNNFFSLNGIEHMNDDAVSKDIWSLFGALYDSVAAAGIGLALMWTLLNIIEKMSEGRMTEEILLSFFAKLTLAAFIIMYGKQLTVTLLSVGNSFVTAFSSEADKWTIADGSTNEVAAEAYNKLVRIKDGHVFSNLGVIIESLIPAFAMLACFVLAVTQLISRILELGIRTAFMPIGVADFMTHGTHSPGMRYLKAYVGCATQGAALYLIVLIGTTLMQSNNLMETIFGDADLGTGLIVVGKPIISILIAISMVGIMKRADHLIHEVFGR